MRIISKLIYIVAILLSYNNSFADWEKLNTPTKPSSINSIGFDEKTIFVSKYNKLYKSENDGKVWEEVNSFKIPDTSQINGLLVKGDTIVLGTNLDYGIYLSTDKGENWEKSIDSNILYTYDFDYNIEFLFAISSKGLAKSTNFGLSWELEESDTVNYYSARYISTDSNIVLTGAPKPNVPIEPSVGGGAYLSLDFGYTWQSVQSGLDVKSVFVKNNILYLGTNNGIFWSSDFGVTWESFVLNSKVNNITISEDKIIASTIDRGVFISSDNGKSWETQNVGLKDYHTTILKNINSKLFLNCWDALYTTRSIEEPWEYSNFSTENIISFQLTSDNDTLYYNRYFGGIIFSSDLGETWHTFNEDLNNEYPSPIIFTKKDNHFVGTNYNRDKIFYSTNGVNYGTSKTEDSFICRKFLIHKDKFYCLTQSNGLYISKDYGVSWQQELDTVFVKDYSFLTQIFAVDNSIYISSNTGKIIYSNDGGISWDIFVLESLIGKSVYCAGIHASEGNVYTIFNDNRDSYLYMLDNKTKQWSLAGIIPELNVQLFSVINDIFILTSKKGIFLTSNFGMNLIELNDGLSELGKLYITGNTILDNYVFICNTYGVYKRPLSDFGITSVETQRNYLYTLPPYPLPSQNEVKVQFYWDINLPMTADDITVYDITGRKLITKDKIRLEKQADHYGNLIWDCSNVEPGIYLINIKHGTEERSVKVVLE